MAHHCHARAVAPALALPPAEVWWLKSGARGAPPVQLLVMSNTTRGQGSSGVELVALGITTAGIKSYHVCVRGTYAPVVQHCVLRSGFPVCQSGRGYVVPFESIQPGGQGCTPAA